MKPGDLVELEWESLVYAQVEALCRPWRGLVGVVIENGEFSCRVYWAGATEDLRFTSPVTRYLRPLS